MWMIFDVINRFDVQLIPLSDDLTVEPLLFVLVRVRIHVSFVQLSMISMSSNAVWTPTLRVVCDIPLALIS